jgi:3,4-dihydroxy 2-butanone 4-phosphate synthase/GTP cyclohydrolase II
MVVHPFATIEAALADVRDGRMVVVCDDESPLAEGALTLAAERVTPAAINFMACHGRGIVCLALTPERCDAMALDPMAARNDSPFTVSVEARDGVTTGISAADRAHTIHVAIHPDSAPVDLVQPGHVFPLRARPGGVLERARRTEAAVDLARLAGCAPAGVTCEVLNDDGTMARVADLVHYCAEHAIKLVTVTDLIAYRRRHEQVVERVASASLPTTFGHFAMLGYRSTLDDGHHVALVKGEVADRDDVLVLRHAECLAGHVFHAIDCDCGGDLESGLARIERAGAGVLLYLSAGRGAAWLEAMAAHGAPSAHGAHDGIAEQILADLGVAPRAAARARALSSSPA